MKKNFAALIAILAFAAPAMGQQVSTGRATTSAPSYVSGTASPLSLDTSGNLRTNCVSGCSGGSFNNNSDGVATSSTNGQAAAWLYGFNGTTWDRARADTTAGLWTQLKAALPAGSAIIGKVGIDQTTPGTTNGVQVNAALPAGTSIIGKVGIDQTTPGTTNGVQITGGSLAANQSVNVAQINGVTPLMGAGNTGTGSPRVTISTDQAALAAAGQGATGSAVPAGATLAGARSGANLVGLIQADASVALTMSTATTTQFVGLSGSTKIYVTAFSVIANGTTNVTIVYGTGSNCGTGTTSLTGAYPLTAQAGLTLGAGLGPVLVVPAGNALCVTNSAAVQISGNFAYTQF